MQGGTSITSTLCLTKNIFVPEGEGNREGGKHQCVVASHAHPTGDLACNPGMCRTQLGIELATPWFTGWHSIH